MQSPYRFFRLMAAICPIAVTSTFTLAAAADDPVPQPLFESHELLRIQIEAPFTTLMRDRNSGEYQDGLLHLAGLSGTQETVDLKLRARGNYRRKAENCDFAPLRLNFRKKQVRETVFAGQDKLKLVTHCDNFRREYEQSVLREYLAYRILNQLTDLSFRVRLLQVDYIDTDRENKTRTKYGILIEDDEALFRRIGLPFAGTESADPGQLDPQRTALFSVFQYFIGNTDFSALRGAAGEFCCHNAVLAGGPDISLIPIPYDFDLSGLVDAPYATPNPKLKISKVTQRLYRGYCLHNEQLGSAIGLLSEKRDSIERLVEQQEGLSKASRQSVARFIDGFYDRVSSDSGIQRNLVRECL